MANTCLCGLAKSYETCCGFLHQGNPAASAEALMRSRYSAYVLNNLSYLRDSWHSSSRPAVIEPDTEAKWLGLSIKESRQMDETHAEVEFVARYKIAGKAYRLHERSRFVWEQGLWWYVDGELY